MIHFMADVRDYIRLFDTNNVLKWFFLIMLCGLVLVGEAVVLLFAVDRFSRYYVLACLTGSAVIGLLLTWPAVHRIVKHIRKDIAEGEFPEHDMERLLGTIASGIFMLIPGFVTDCLGLIIFFFGLRRPVGKLIMMKNRDRLFQAYEYLKLYD
jgi:UPF0716 protein FxsA